MDVFEDIVAKFEIAKEFSGDEKFLKQKFIQKLINLKKYYIKEQDKEKNTIKSIKDEGFSYEKNMPNDIIDLKLQIIKQFMEFPINTMLKKIQQTQNCGKIKKYAEDFGVIDIYDRSETNHYHCLCISIPIYLEALNHKLMSHRDVINVLLILLSAMDNSISTIEDSISNIKDTIKSDIKTDHLCYSLYYNKYIDFYINFKNNNYNAYLETEDNLEKHLQQCKYVKENIICLIKMLNSYYSDINNINSVQAKIDECQEKIDNYDKLIKEIDDSLDSNFE